MTDDNVVPMRTEAYPRCPHCRHEWHGAPCTMGAWPRRGVSGSGCPCDSSLDTEPGGDAA